MTETLTVKPRTVTSGFKQQRISQTRGLTYRGEMRLIAEFTTDPDGKKPAWQELEIWETRSGKWITVIMGKYDNNSRGNDEFTKATLFKDVRRDDLDFQIAVMESLDWSKAARVMVREQLGWKLIEEVE